MVVFVTSLHPPASSNRAIKMGEKKKTKRRKQKQKTKTKTTTKEKKRKKKKKERKKKDSVHPKSIYIIRQCYQSPN